MEEKKNQVEEFELSEKIKKGISDAYAKARERVKDPDDEFFMAGVLPFEPGECAHYTPTAFRNLPAEMQAEFDLVGYSDEDVAAYREVHHKNGNLVAAQKQILKSSGVIGWKNLQSRTKKAIEVGDKSFLDRAPERLIGEIHTMCWAYATGIIPIEMEGLG